MTTPQPLAAADVLALWERGAARHPLDRTALLVAAARPGLPAAQVHELPLGEVTACLLALRGASFGHRIAGHVDCPQCGERLALALDARALLTRPADVGAGGMPSPGESVEAAGLRLRAPTLRDLAAVAADADADPEIAARRLLARCTLEGDASRLDAAALQEAEQALERLDPNADLALRLVCVVCGEAVEAQLDAGALLWQEIEAMARSLLQEVHQLARVYGWSEREILSLAPARRAGYLAMVAA